MAKQDSSLTQDWPLSLIRSEARDTLAQQIHEARCKWALVHVEWKDLPVDRRSTLRMLATQIIKQGLA